MSHDPKEAAIIQQFGQVFAPIVAIQTQKNQQPIQYRIALLNKLNQLLNKIANIKQEYATGLLSKYPSWQSQNEPPGYPPCSNPYKCLQSFITCTVQKIAQQCLQFRNPKPPQSQSSLPSRITPSFPLLKQLLKNERSNHLFHKSFAQGYEQQNRNQKRKEDFRLLGCHWINGDGIYLEFRNFVFFGAVQVVMGQIGVEGATINGGFGLFGDVVGFLEGVAVHLNKKRLMELLKDMLKQVNQIVQKEDKFKQFAKTLTTSSQAKFIQDLKSIVSQIDTDTSLFKCQIKTLRQFIQKSLNNMGLMLLQHQSLQKRLMGLKFLKQQQTDQKYFLNCLQQKSILALLLQQSQIAIIQNSQLIFKSVLNNLCEKQGEGQHQKQKQGREILQTIFNYAKKSTPEIRKCVFRYIEGSNVVNNWEWFEGLLAGLVQEMDMDGGPNGHWEMGTVNVNINIGQNGDRNGNRNGNGKIDDLGFYSQEVFQFVRKFVNRGSFGFLADLIRKTVPVYLNALDIKNISVLYQCRKLISQAVCKIIEKRTVTQNDFLLKIELLQSILQLLLQPPLTVQKITLLSTIIPHTLSPPSYSADPKKLSQTISKYLLNEKNILQLILMWLNDLNSHPLVKQIESIIQSTFRQANKKKHKTKFQQKPPSPIWNQQPDYKQKQKDQLQQYITNTDILLQSTINIKLFQNLIGLWDGQTLQEMGKKFGEFVRKCYQVKGADGFQCVKLYFLAINRQWYGTSDDDCCCFQAKCVPDKLVGVADLIQVLMQLRDYFERNQIAQFISSIYHRYSENVMFQSQDYLKTIYTEFSNNFALQCHASLAENKVESALGYLALISQLMLFSQIRGVGAYRPHNTLVSVSLVSVTLKIQVQRPKNERRQFQRKYPSNKIFIQFVQQACAYFQVDIFKFQVREGNNPIPLKFYGLTLEQLKIDGKYLKLWYSQKFFSFNKTRKQRVRQIVSQNQTQNQIAPNKMTTQMQIQSHTQKTQKKSQQQQQQQQQKIATKATTPTSTKIKVQIQPQFSLKLTQKATKVVTEMFHFFANEDGKMGIKQCRNFVISVTKTSVSSKDQRAQNLLLQFDDDHDGFLTLHNFIHFYSKRAKQESSSDFWSNLLCVGYRFDLKKQCSEVDPLPYDLLFRSYLSQNQDIYLTLFQMLKYEDIQLQQRSSSILQRLPTYKLDFYQFLKQQKFQIVDKNCYQIEYFLIILLHQIQTSRCPIQTLLSQNLCKQIVALLKKLLQFQKNNEHQVKSILICLKIIRYVCPIPLLSQQPIDSIDTEQITGQLQISDIDILSSILGQALKQNKIQQVQQLFALKIYIHVVKEKQKHKDKQKDKEKDMNNSNVNGKSCSKINKIMEIQGLKQAIIGINHRQPIINKMACNFIFYLNMVTDISTDIFALQINQNPEIWYNTLVKLIQKNNSLDLSQISASCIQRLSSTKQSLQCQHNPQLKGNLLLLHTIISKSPSTFKPSSSQSPNSTSALSFQKLLTISQHTLHPQSRLLLYKIMSQIDYQSTIFYVKEMVLTAIQEAGKDISIKNCFVGLKNLSNTCYVNAILQVFFAIQGFRNAMLAMDVQAGDRTDMDSQGETDGQFNWGLLKQIKRLYQYLKYGYGKFYDTANFCSFYRNRQNNPINVKQQEDVHQFYNHFCQVMEKYFIKFKKKEEFDKMFQGKIVSELTCSLCQQKIKRQQPYRCINLQVKGHQSLKQSLDKFTQSQNIYDYNCQKCQRKGQKFTKHTSFLTLPSHLIINLLRIIPSIQASVIKYVKISSKLSFPQKIDLSPYLSAQSSPSHSSGPQSHMYTLKAVIIHTGNCHSGHYYAIIRVGDKWYKFNDERVTECSYASMEAEAFGNQNIVAYQDGVHSESAYLLCYQNGDQGKPQGEKLDRDILDLIKQEKVQLIKQIKVYNESAFQFCYKLFQQIKPYNIEQTAKNESFVPNWQNDEVYSKYEQIFDLSLVLQKFLKKHWKFQNPIQIAKLGTQIYYLLYLVPAKSYDFISRIDANEVKNMLCLHQDYNVRNTYKYIFAKTIKVFYQFYKFDFHNDDPAAAQLAQVIAKLKSFLSDKQFHEKIYFMESYLEFWVLCLQGINQVNQYIIQTDMLYTLLQLLSNDNSKIQQNYSTMSESQKQKQIKIVPPSMSKIICKIIKILFDCKLKKAPLGRPPIVINLTEQQQQPQPPSPKQTIELALSAFNQPQLSLLTCPNLYSNILTNCYDADKCLASVIARLSQHSWEFCVRVAMVFIKTLKKCGDKGTWECLDILLYYLEQFLKQDSMRRCKWIFGIWQFEIGDTCIYGFAKNVYSNLFRYYSTLLYTQEYKFSSVLQYLVNFNNQNKQFCIHLLKFVLKIAQTNDTFLHYIKNLPSPTCIYANYFNWIDSFSKKLEQTQQKYFPQSKKTVMQSLKSQYEKLKQSLKPQNEQQLQQPPNKVLIGINNELDIKFQFCKDKLFLHLFQHQTFTLPNIPTGKQNLSIPPNFFSQPQSHYFLSCRHPTKPQPVQSNPPFQCSKTVLTLQIQSQNWYTLYFSLQKFQQEIIIQPGRCYVNFHYENFQGIQFDRFLDIMPFQFGDQENDEAVQKMKEGNGGGQYRHCDDRRVTYGQYQGYQVPQHLKRTVEIVQDNRNKKSCQRCTLLNEINAQECDVCGNAFMD